MKTKPYVSATRAPVRSRSIALSDDDWNALDRESSDRGLSVSAYMRMILRDRQTAEGKRKAPRR